MNDATNQKKVSLLLEDGRAYPLEGTLQFRDITVDPTTGSVILRLVFPNPKALLLPGMFVRAVVKEGISEKAILIPQQAVSRDPKGNAVALIVDDTGKVQQRMLMIDRAIGDKWLVTSGLGPGDRVIVEGLQRVRPGASVKEVPLNATLPAAKSN
jgi:membrane fusion protein (multidrug efflux system)